jgi:Zn finger protein HypA/HybF involved in hydrogenase expression
MSLVEAAERTTVESESTARTHGQKYLLQRRNDEGHLIKVETFNELVSPEKVIADFGPGSYILKTTKPRFKTVWRQKVGEIDQAKELQSLKRRTKHLAFGLVGLGVIELVGLILTHLGFSRLKEDLEKIKAIFQTLHKPEGLRCVNCGKPLDFVLQNFCSQCGTQIDWPRKPLPTNLNEVAGECFSCKSPLFKHQIYCPHCGAQRPVPFSSEANPWGFVPTTRSGSRPFDKV